MPSESQRWSLKAGCESCQSAGQQEMGQRGKRLWSVEEFVGISQRICVFGQLVLDFSGQ